MKVETIYTDVFGEKFNNFKSAITHELNYFKHSTIVCDKNGNDITQKFYETMWEEANEDFFSFDLWCPEMMKNVSTIEFADGDTYKAFVNAGYLPNMDIHSNHLLEKTDWFMMYNTDFIYNEDDYEDFPILRTLALCQYRFVDLYTVEVLVEKINSELNNIKLAIENATDGEFLFK